MFVATALTLAMAQRTTLPRGVVSAATVRQDAPQADPPPKRPSLLTKTPELEKPPQPLSPETWMSDSDYPPAAYRAHEEGLVHFRLSVDPKGRVAGCVIVSSAATARLDAAACAFLTQRARFKPAMDERHRAIASTYSSRFRWTIPEQEVPFVSLGDIFRFEISESGTVSRCTLEVPGSPIRDGQCDSAPDLSESARAILLGQARHGAAVAVIRWRRSDGSPPVVVTDRAGGRTVFRRRMHFIVDEAGHVPKCDVIERVGEDVLNLAPFDCHPGVKFPEADPANPVRRGATMEIRVTARPLGDDSRMRR